MCSVVLRVVNAKTMTPITKIQVAIDTSIYPDNAPPSYTFGVGEDGTTTYSGGHVLEITNRAHNGVVRLGNPPDRIPAWSECDPVPSWRQHGPHLSSTSSSPTTVLLDVVKDCGRADPVAGPLVGQIRGKYAAPPKRTRHNAPSALMRN